MEVFICVVHQVFPQNRPLDFFLATDRTEMCYAIV